MTARRDSGVRAGFRDDAAFGCEIRWLRESRGLGLRDLADLAALSPSFLSRLERGLVPPPSAPTVSRLAEVLRADPDALLVASGRAPGHVLETIRRRPVVLRLLRALAEMSDEEIERWVNSIRHSAMRSGAC